MRQVISSFRCSLIDAYVKVPMLIAFGSVCLFGSAIAQNYFTARWSQEKADLHQLQLLVAIQEGTSTQYLIELSRLQTSKESTENQRLDITTMYAEHAMIQLSLGMMQALGSDANSDDINITEQTILDTAKLMRERKDINALLALVNKLQNDISTYGPKMIQDARDRYREVSKLEDKWNKIFLGLYVLGSVSIAVGYLRSWVTRRAPNE